MPKKRPAQTEEGTVFFDYEHLFSRPLKIFLFTVIQLFNQ